MKTERNMDLCNYYLHNKKVFKEIHTSNKIMSIYNNPSTYISIFSSICLVASEILPFIPIKGNGIIHAILECLSSLNKPQPTRIVTDYSKKTPTVTSNNDAGNI